MAEKIPPGPWSDPSPSPARTPPAPKRRRAIREPFITNWRGLAIIAFLLLLAPSLARWASHLIMGMIGGR